MSHYGSLSAIHNPYYEKSIFIFTYMTTKMLSKNWLIRQCLYFVTGIAHGYKRTIGPFFNYILKI